MSDALFDALCDDDQAAIRAHISDAATLVQQRLQPQTSSSARTAMANPSVVPYVEACTLADMLACLTVPVANVGSDMAATAISAAGHSARLTAPRPEDWAALPIAMHALRATAGEIGSYCSGEKRANMALAPPPDVLSSEYVAQMLCQAHGCLNPCVRNEMCIGLQFGGMVLMRYMSPAHFNSYRLTGVVPASRNALCYLCLLALWNTAATAAASEAVPVQQLTAPFCHYLNAPGGYLREALHSSASHNCSSGITYLVRRLCRTDYVVGTRKILQPVAWDSDTKIATQWEPYDVACLSERVDLLFGSTKLPNVGLCVGAAELPPCERFLADRRVARIDIQEISVEMLPQLNTFAKAVTANFVLLQMPFGCDLPKSFEVSVTGVALRETLALADFAVARVRLVHAFQSAGSSRSEDVVRSVALLPSAFRFWTAPPTLRVRETLPSILEHSMLFLLLLRCDYLHGLMAEYDATIKRVTETGGTGTMAAAELASATEMRHKVGTYYTAMLPLLAYYTTCAAQGRPLSDGALFRPQSNEAPLLYSTLRPVCPPTYFSAGDLIKLCDTTPAVANEARGATQPLNYLCFSLIGDHLPEIGSAASPLARVAWPERALLCSPDFRRALLWVAERGSFLAVGSADLSLGTGELMPGVALVGGALANTPAQINAHLAALLRLSSAADTTLVWRTLALRAELMRLTRDILMLAHPEHHGARQRRQRALSAIGPALADALYAAVTRNGRVDVVDDLAPALVARGGGPGGGSGGESDESWRVSAAMCELSVAMHADASLCAELLMAAAYLDVDALPIVEQRISLCAAGPYGARLDAGLVCGAQLELDGLNTLIGHVLAEALPSSTVHTGGLLDRISTALAASAVFGEFVAECCAALLAGLNAEACHLPSVGRRTVICLALQCRESPRCEWPLMLPRLPISLIGMALREFIATQLCQTPSVRATLDGQYTNLDGWLTALWDATDRLRAAPSEPLAKWSPANARLLVRAAPVDVATLLTAACVHVDMLVAADISMADGVPVSAERLRPPATVLEYTEQYAAALAPYQPYRPEWLTRLGVSENVARQLGELRDAAAARAVVFEVALAAPNDYAVVSLLFRVRAQTVRRRLVLLDSEMAKRQLGAVLRYDGVYMPHMHDAAIGSVLCCNRIRNIRVQEESNYSGLHAIRLNLDSGTLLCTERRARAQPKAPHTGGAYEAARNAIAHYHRSRAYDMEQGSGDSQARTAHLAQVMAEAQKKTQAHATVVQKTVMQLPCGRPPLCVPLIGAVMELRTTGAPRSRTDSCTICPRCARKTAFAPCMFGPNGFTCGVCDSEARVAAAFVNRYDEPRCCICTCTRVQASLVARKLGLYPRFTRHVGVDDVSVPGAPFTDQLWLCAVCYQSWISGALSTSLTLSEVRALHACKLPKSTRLDEITHPSDDVEALRRLAAIRAGERIEVMPYSGDLDHVIATRIGSAPDNRVLREARQSHADNAKALRRRRDERERERADRRKKHSEALAAAAKFAIEQPEVAEARARAMAALGLDDDDDGGLEPPSDDDSDGLSVFDDDSVVADDADGQNDADDDA